MTEPQQNFITNIDALVASVARLCAAAGLAREVAVLTFGTPELGEPYENFRYSIYPIQLHLPINVFNQIEDDKSEIEQNLNTHLKKFKVGSEHKQLDGFVILPAITDDPGWPAVQISTGD